MTLNELRKLVWNAEWIWSPGPDEARYAVRHFRRTFDVPDPRQAELTVHVSADSRYRFYVNGELVGRGPARGDLDHYNFETYHLADRLRPGRNVLAVQVMAYGADGPIAEIHDPHGAFVLQGSLKTPEGETPLDTDERWRVLADAAYSPRICEPRGYFAVNPLERFDGSAFPWGWQDVDYDDSSWSAARRIGRAAGRNQSGHPRHRWRLVPREIAPLREEQVAVEAVIDGPRSDELRRLLAPGGGRAVTIEADSEVEWTLYMGKLFTGYPAVTVDGGRGAEIEITYAEALTRDGAKSRRDDLSYGEVEGGNPSDVFCPGGRKGETYEPICYRCARFIRLRVRTAGQPLVLRGLHFTFTCYPFEQRAEFDSDDPQLKRIWDVAWHTALCCAHEHYEDCPFYEQLQYVSDTRLQVLISYLVAGDDVLPRAALRAFDTSRLYEGLTQSRYPSNLEQIIPTFSLFYILMIEDHYWHYGDLAYLRRLSPGIHGVLHWFEGRMTADGLLGYIPWWSYVDWCPEWREGVPPEANDGPSTTINLQLVAAIQSASALSRALGDVHRATEYDDRARAIQQAVQRLCWSEREGLVVDGPGSTNLSQHANLWAVLTDTAGERQTARIMRRLMDDPGLIRTSYIHDYYLFQMLLKVGAYERLEAVISRWREMIDYGFSTFPEKPEPARSDCHGWSAWPMFEFLRVLLGVRPREPGYAAVAIAPQPFGRVTEARGCVPTCRGTIHVAWKADGGRFGLRARVPVGIPVEVRLPDGRTCCAADGGEVVAGDSALAPAEVLGRGQC